MTASGASDLGDREHQEDVWLVAERGEATLCVVCDGMGACTSGAPAAALTASLLRAAFESGAEPEDVMATLQDAHRDILGRSAAAQRRKPGSDPRWHGMGTTAEVAVFTPGRVHLGHVGDGGIYRFRSGRLEPMTVAHTLLNEVRRLRPGASEADLARIPAKVIVRALGMQADLEVDRRDVDALAGDVWLLCSDGLTSIVSDEEISATLSGGGSAAHLARTLMVTARKVRRPWEPRDNITLIVHAVRG
ncbi:MAG: serine/threonine-protein phosphatase [Deltaproteobacteria bacterium]|nr:serine/threonine-protein phosphatase [Deltaproteobacteria bacterium]